jgi:hypothetical protein
MNIAIVLTVAAVAIAALADLVRLAPSSGPGSFLDVTPRQ